MRPRSAHPAPGASPAMLETMRAGRAAHPRATVAEIEVEATRQMAAVRRELIATALETEPAATAPVCAACGRVMVRTGTRQRTIITSQAERVPVTGPRDRCPACGAERFPPR